MIHIAAPTYDPEGAAWVPLAGDGDMRSISRRNNRIPTLDGGAALNDTGHTAADRTFTITSRAVPGRYEKLQRFLTLYPKIIITTPDGVFEAAPDTLTQRGDRLRFVTLVLRQLA